MSGDHNDFGLGVFAFDALQFAFEAQAVVEIDDRRRHEHVYGAHGFAFFRAA